jgi:hypothetical protein
LLAFAQGYRGDVRRHVRRTADKPWVVELHLDERVRPLVGRVLAPDGGAAPHAHVRIGVLDADVEPPEQEPTWIPIGVRCDARGRFSVDLAPDGFALRVLAQSDAGAPTVAPVASDAPPQHEVVVKLDPGTELVGALTFNGHPAANALVIVECSLPGHPRDLGFSAISDASGRYSIRGLPAGSHKIGAFMPLATDDPWAWAKAKTDMDLAQAWERLELAAGVTVDWNATLERKE